MAKAIEITAMKRLILLNLIGAFFGIVITACAELRTNHLMIGGMPVDTKVVDGQLFAEQLVAISNNLYIIRTRATVPSGLPVVSDTSTNDDSNPCLHLMLHTGDGPLGRR